MNTLGTMLARRRKKLGLTLRQMEERTGLSNPHLSQLETGYTRNPTILTAVAISGGYGIPLGRLVKAVIHDASEET